MVSHSYSEQKLMRLDPNISLSNPSCYEEIDFFINRDFNNKRINN